jgi:VWFA-related protein
MRLPPLTKIPRAACLLACGALAFGVALAQSAGQQADAPPAGQNAPEMSVEDAPATFSTRVNLVLVPVVVRDRQGRAVGTLQREDFRIFDKGKPRAITRFSVEKPGTEQTVDEPIAGNNDGLEPARTGTTPPRPIADHFVVFLFDDVHLSTGDLLQVRAAAERHIQAQPDPATRFAVYSTSGRTTLDFTDDRDQLRAALARLQSRPDNKIGPFECPEIDYYMGDLIQNKHDARALGAAADDAKRCPEFPPNLLLPGMEEAAQQQAEQMAASVALRAVNLGDADTRLALSVVSDIIRRLAIMPGARSIVLVSPGFLLTDQRREETDIIDRAIRARVTINSLNALGVATIIPGGDASKQGTVNIISAAVRTEYQSASFSLQGDVLEELADATGGNYFHNNNDLTLGFSRVAAEPEFRYLLGFAPQERKLDGGLHLLKVTLKDARGLTLQARRGYYVPEGAIDPDADARQEIEDAMFSRDERRDIPVELNTQFFKSSDENARLAVVARVDVKRLLFRKAEGRNQDTLTILSGVFDRAGNYIAGIQKVVRMNLRDQTLESLSNSGISVRTNFDVTPGTYVIRLVVRDAEGRTMAARNRAIEIP